MNRWPAFLTLIALVVAAGCGSGTGRVEGKLVWEDGTPAKQLEGSEVVFESAELKVSSRGVIGKEGEFMLRTAKPDDGCPVGSFQVAVVEFRKNANQEGTLLVPAILDEKFGDLKTSGLTATVKAGTNPITLKVQKASKR
jgi:hypothetical protein